MVPCHGKGSETLPQLHALKGSCCGMVNFRPIIQQAPLEGIRIFSNVMSFSC